MTVSQISGGINSEFWTTNVLQAAMLHPAIWHASLALSAMHQRMMMTASKTIVPPSDLAEDYYEFSLTQYNASISHTSNLLKKASLTQAEKEEILMTGIIYTGISFLQNNIPQAVIHAQNTLRIYHHWQFRDLAAKQAKTVLGSEHILQLLQDIYFALLTSGIDVHESIVTHFDKVIGVSQKPFESITEAYYEFLPIHRGQVHFPGARRFSDIILPTEDHMRARQRAFGLWDRRFEAFRKTPAYNKADTCILQTLTLLRSVEHIFQAIMQDRTPKIWAKNRARWEKVVEEAEAILENMKDRERAGLFLPQFTFSMSFLEVFRMVGLISRDGVLRRRIITCLKNWPLRDSLQDSRLTWRTIETKMAVEEIGMHAGGTCECQKDIYVCTDHRVSRFDTSIPDERTVVFTVRTGMDVKSGKPGRKFTHVLQ